MELYPLVEPFHTEHLQVSDLHSIYVEQAGNPEGIPVIFIHGGPGGGLHVEYRQFFDPEKWRVILFDQRGCGKSKPFAELRENTTWDLVADMEKIRLHLGVEKWALFGGSWGSTLSLAYAQTHPNHCLGMVLRGIFLLRKKEIDWFYQEGASKIFPEAWRKYIEPIPPSERGNMLEAYHKYLTSEDADLRNLAAKCWSIWEGSCSHLHPNPNTVNHLGDQQTALAMARIENHYFMNNGFFRNENQLLEDIDKIRHIPGVIVHGRYDMVCPVESAFELAELWPEADLKILPDSGHSCMEEGTRSELLKSTNQLYDKLKNQS